MKRAFLSLVILFNLVCGIPALAQGTPEDDRLYDQVRQKLVTNRDVNGGTIQVEVKDGVVTLRGKVREERHKVRAEQLARKVKGVKKVINELEPEIK